MNSLNRLAVSITEKGYPCLWEKGGNGRATIIADEEGSPKLALYARSKGHLANDNHALVALREGDVVVEVKGDDVVVYRVIQFMDEVGEGYAKGLKDRRDFATIANEVASKVCRKRGQLLNPETVDSVDMGLFVEVVYKYTQKTAVVEIIGRASNGKWTAVPNDKYIKAIDMAMQKADDKHCVEAYYAIPPRDKRKEV